jgi:hypothetical protein
VTKSDDVREYERLIASHDKLMNERARLILSGIDPADLAMPLAPIKPVIMRHDPEAPRPKPMPLPPPPPPPPPS